ncbi:MAG: flagellar hook protein [Sulfurimonas sp. RIFOXYD12_FULL_33_39]|uniref:flagellar filament capping protein FliD n=1 Tax=unclassified Sulfurimonas TaxID=2623549 RepID=UPI0008BDEACE|nr:MULTISPECIES: flagellar filament capping protein FliD [unclassified Sulfurimonas]OHE10332.1 MAG: flagellar hook protein [Sulfurimonas sp. RIFOXYD12_FULL_33_39]OHE13092.1 MAG: flagellar hook protein [Sulfurimonas sp. RIFOXYD2_FULL_34_21]DAB28361.1 MAG TPA: flagellar hook protein [Sulfurimonas sp. UBA10385]
MGISSLGVGSSILTQDVLDQLRKADEAQIIQPITLSLANENDKQDSLEVIDASMTNFRDSINELKSATLFDGRSTTVTGTSVEVTASANSDVQDFTINVDHLATKQIEQSGAFSASTDTVASGAGTLTLNVGAGTPVTINYDATTTLDDLKKLINDNAGDQVDATVVKISATESRLFISSKETGAAQDISITDNSALLDTKLTTGLTTIQTGIDNQFTFNGQTITRSSNTVDDLITGYSIKLKEAGSSDVSVAQDREAIMTKVDSFVEKYNSLMTEFSKQTKPSTDSDERGIFSGDSTIKSMQRAIQDMIASVGGGVGSMEDYGFSVDRDGKMSIDKTILTAKLDENPTNVEAFFTGGDYTKDDLSVVTLTGAFVDFYEIANGYAKTNGGLDQVKDALSESISALEDKKTSATERLDAKYEILKKQYAAYDAMIAKINNASSMFTQLANAQTSDS